MTPPERAIVFDCEGARLLGVVHPSARPARRGVLIVVGGPQYRVGSHRQFVLLGRTLARADIPAMRFDYRGMGDSDGAFRGFEEIGADIAKAIDAFLEQCGGLSEVVLWGLCDAASAICFYAHSDSRISGIVLLNPWARTNSGQAQTYLRHYYIDRLRDLQFWRKLTSGRVDLGHSLRSFVKTLQSSIHQDRTEQHGRCSSTPTLPNRMAEGLMRFRRRSLLILSENDLTAREFELASGASDKWRKLLATSQITRHELSNADHTFSRRQWRDEVCDLTITWVRELPDVCWPASGSACLEDRNIR